jgi:hypothetical protein
MLQPRRVMSSRGQKVTHARPTPCVGNRTLSRPPQPKGATSTGANQGEIVILPDQIPWGPVDARGASAIGLLSPKVVEKLGYVMGIVRERA